MLSTKDEVRELAKEWGSDMDNRRAENQRDTMHAVLSMSCGTPILFNIR